MRGRPRGVPCVRKGADRVMEKVRKITEKITEAVNLLSCVAIVVMMLVIMADVILRIFSGYVKGQLEIVSYCMVCVVWFAVGRVVMKGEMIQVNIFRVGPVVELINKLISIALCVLGCVGAIKESAIALQFDSTSNILHIPQYPFMWVTAFGFALIAIATIVLIVYELHKKRRPDTSAAADGEGDGE
jgi:TRAP-type C4-dicarboxylate transport system permease small subunit